MSVENENIQGWEEWGCYPGAPDCYFSGCDEFIVRHYPKMVLDGRVVSVDELNARPPRATEEP